MSLSEADAIWVEVLSRQHEVAARQRFVSLPITIGRAYDNDVVVDDPHVAAHHVRIVRDDAGALVAEDLGSRNGLHAERERERRATLVLDGAHPFRIGATLVRVRASSFAVAAEEPVQRGAWYWPAAIACVAGVYVLAVLDLWLGETGEPKAIHYFTPLLILTVIVCVWTAAWAVVTRVFRGHARFGRHFLIAAGGLFAFSLYDQAAEVGAFAWSWTSLATTSYVAGWLLLGAMCYSHLVAIHRVRRPLKLAIAVVVAATGIAMQTLKHNEARANYGQPVTLSRLEPPALRMVAPQRESAFFTDAAALRETLDKARTDEPSGGDAASDDD